MLWLSEESLSRIDEYARLEGKSRGSWIEAIVQIELDRRAGAQCLAAEEGRESQAPRQTQPMHQLEAPPPPSGARPIRSFDFDSLAELSREELDVRLHHWVRSLQKASDALDLLRIEDIRAVLSPHGLELLDGIDDKPLILEQLVDLVREELVNRARRSSGVQRRPATDAGSVEALYEMACESWPGSGLAEQARRAGYDALLALRRGDLLLARKAAERARDLEQQHHSGGLAWTTFHQRITNVLMEEAL
ncbi:MAG: hypothetical protein OEY14_11210 [Myxococcales bacterium]|nr:hypothetical protein [Myxococcales bacterium]